MYKQQTDSNAKAKKKGKLVKLTIQYQQCKFARYFNGLNGGTGISAIRLNFRPILGFQLNFRPFLRYQLNSTNLSYYYFYWPSFIFL